MRDRYREGPQNRLITTPVVSLVEREHIEFIHYHKQADRETKTS